MCVKFQCFAICCFEKKMFYRYETHSQKGNLINNLVQYRFSCPKRCPLPLWHPNVWHIPSINPVYLSVGSLFKVLHTVFKLLTEVCKLFGWMSQCAKDCCSRGLEWVNKEVKCANAACYASRARLDSRCVLVPAQSPNYDLTIIYST